MQALRATNWLLAVIAILLAVIALTLLRGGGKDLIPAAHAQGTGSGNPARVLVVGCLHKVVVRCDEYRALAVDDDGRLLVKADR